MRAAAPLRILGAEPVLEMKWTPQVLTVDHVGDPWLHELLRALDVPIVAAVPFTQLGRGVTVNTIIDALASWRDKGSVAHLVVGSTLLSRTTRVA